MTIVEMMPTPMAGVKTVIGNKKPVSVVTSVVTRKMAVINPIFWEPIRP
jgi:hypothetical protein